MALPVTTAARKVILHEAAAYVECLELLDPSGLSRREQLRIYDVLQKAADGIRNLNVQPKGRA